MKKNVAGQKVGAQMVSATDGSAFTGSVTVYVTLDAGAQAIGSVGGGACTHEGNGLHTYAPAQAETNGDLVEFTFIGTGAVPQTLHIYTSFPQTGDSYPTINTNLDAAVTTRLAPTTAGRTLDVSATGEAGIDWANVGSPTTVVGLSGTTIKTATDVETDTQDIQNRLPAALVGGRMDSNVQAMANNVVTAAAIADGAIDRATFAADTGMQTSRSNTAQGGAAGNIQLDASASGTNDYYNDQIVYLTGGTGAGQSRLISDYDQATKTATVVPNWATAPDNTTTFAIIPFTRVDLALWLGTAMSALISGRVDANTQAMANSVIDSTKFAAGAVDAAALATDAVTEIWAKACTEPTAVVAAAPTAIAALSWLLTLSRNKIEQTSTTQTLRADDGATAIASSTVSDDGTTFTRGEFA
jgi:hypothetical protein